MPEPLPASTWQLTTIAGDVDVAGEVEQRVVALSGLQMSDG